LLPKLSPTFTVEVQLAAIQCLGRFRDPRMVPAYLDEWPSFSPRVRAAVLEVLFAEPRGVAATFAAVRDGRLPAAELPLERLRSVASHGATELRAEAEALIAARGRGDLEELIDRYRQRLGVGGDSARGQALFRDHCAGCHRLGDYGHELGPSLAGTRHKGADFMLVHVLDPNREVNPLYFNYVALLEDGRTTTGLIVEESAVRLTLQRADGARETFQRSEIQELRNTGRSLMPEGLEKSLDPAQMQDLLWYLLDSQ
jgi:putative heme-binding domain-containing protein